MSTLKSIEEIAQLHPECAQHLVNHQCGCSHALGEGENEHILYFSVAKDQIEVFTFNGEYEGPHINNCGLQLIHQLAKTDALPDNPRIQAIGQISMDFERLARQAFEYKRAIAETWMSQQQQIDGMIDYFLVVLGIANRKRGLTVEPGITELGFMVNILCTYAGASKTAEDVRHAADVIEAELTDLVANLLEILAPGKTFAMHIYVRSADPVMVQFEAVLDNATTVVQALTDTEDKLESLLDNPNYVRPNSSVKDFLDALADAISDALARAAQQDKDRLN